MCFVKHIYTFQHKGIHFLEPSQHKDIHFTPLFSTQGHTFYDFRLNNFRELSTVVCFLKACIKSEIRAYWRSKLGVGSPTHLPLQGCALGAKLRLRREDIQVEGLVLTDGRVQAAGGRDRARPPGAVMPPGRSPGGGRCVQWSGHRLAPPGGVIGPGPGRGYVTPGRYFS